MSLVPGWSASMLAVSLGSAVLFAEGPGADAKGDLALEVRVVGVDGEAVDRSSINLWRLVSERGRSEDEPGARARGLWREAATGQVWEPIGGVATGDRWRRDDLAPGTYRATGHLGHHQATPVGISDPVVLDGRHRSAVLVLRLRPGPTVSFRLSDAAGGRPVRGAWISLERRDSTLPSPWTLTSPATDDQGRVAIVHLPPGTYTLNASRRANAPEEPEYAAAEKGRTLIVSAGVDQVVPVAMAGRALTPAEIEQRWGWVATGRVVDEFGRPVADAEVRVATGWGTLMGGGTTRTGTDGRFTLRFAEGVLSNDEANAQAAVFMVAKDGYIEKSRSRPGHHMMARKMPRDDARRRIEPDKIILKGRPYPIDFVLAEHAIVDAELRDAAGSALSIVDPEDRDGTISARQDAPNRWAVLPGRPWRFTVPFRATRFFVRSLPITLPRPGHYRAVLRLVPDREGGVDLLEILSMTGPVGGREVRDKVVGDDPMARPPVPEALQQRGRDLLRRMAEASRPWLGPPPAEVRNYEYRFRFGEQEGRTFRVGAEPVAGPVRRGISYASAVHFLAANPTAAVFRQVEAGADRIVLAYTLKEPIGVSAGNGVQGIWHGFFSMPVREGVLVLDAHRFTPLENRSEEMVETFSQHVEVEAGRFVPLAIRIEQGGMRFDWTFQVVEPGLWLFAACEAGPGEAAGRVDRVRVNGADARVVARGEPRAARAD
jgi:hypothetical protein